MSHRDFYKQYKIALSSEEIIRFQTESDFALYNIVLKSKYKTSSNNLLPYGELHIDFFRRIAYNKYATIRNLTFWDIALSL